MPRIELRVKDIEPSVMRPVAFAVIRDLLKVTHLESHTNILFPGGEVAYQPSTTLSAKNENREKHLLSHDKRVFIELDEEYDEDSAITGAVMKPENKYIFADDDLDTYIKPAYSTVNANLTIRYRAKDRIEALRWRDGIRTRIQMGLRELLHHISYSYVIPEPAMILLKEIYTLRENVMGYGQSFEDYKNEFFTVRKTTITTLAGTQPVEAITELQRRIIGSFDFGLRPERAERDANGDAWVIAFSYKYTYLRPISVVMQYPITIHNQLLSEKYRVAHKTDRDEFHLLQHSWSTKAFRHFEPDRLLDMWRKTRGIYLPVFDDFVPGSILLNSLRLFTGLVIIDMDHPEVLMNFNDLGDWKLEDDIRLFLMSEAPYTKRQYNSVFDLSFYRNRNLMDEKLDMIHLESNLDVILDQPVSLRNYFHVRLGILSDLSLLNPDAQLRLRENSCVFQKIINAINPSLDLSQYLHNLDVCGPVSESEWDHALCALSTDPRTCDPNARVGFNTVQGFYIRAVKEDA